MVAPVCVCTTLVVVRVWVIVARDVNSDVMAEVTVESWVVVVPPITVVTVEVIVVCCNVA